MSNPSIPPQVIEALRKYDSPTIANAVEKFEMRDRADGYASLELRCQFPHYEPMVGYAVKRTQDHLIRFTRLYKTIRKGKIDKAWLADIESKDNLFPRIDYRVYA